MEHTILSLLKDGRPAWLAAFGYERERGRFQKFSGRRQSVLCDGRELVGPTKSPVIAGSILATDTHSHMTRARKLIDMEFIQFHPTGMVWPPSVMGIFGDRGVRGEGGILLNKEGKRFMFESIPENYQAHTADKRRRRMALLPRAQRRAPPPELLTRDHVSRCIVSEIKEGRGSPHGGVYLDIS